jgi:TM2 domain-containing membrane protein YozV
MDCVNHTGVDSTAYCQNCGKALCAGCIRKGAGGQVLCEPCQISWQAYQQPFTMPPAPGVPNPAAAAALGLIPGVGAMYNGQFVKGLIHVVIFAVLVSAAHLYGVFGIFIAAWICYQSFEAYHTARARRDGATLPDPLGLNDLANSINSGGQTPPRPPAGQGPGEPVGPAPGSYQAPYTPPYQQPPYSGPYTPPTAGFTNPYAPPVPPMPPVPPPSCGWGHREPIGAIVLIGLGVLFLLGQLDVFSGRIFEYAWPMLLICLGAWLVIRRLGDSQGGKK